MANVPVPSFGKGPAAAVGRKYASQLVTVIKKAVGESAADTVSLMSDGVVQSEVREWISTGFPEADAVFGGYPVGRCIEISGPEAAGKSAEVHLAIKAVQMMGGLAILNDFEHSLDPPKLQQLKIDPERLIVASPEYAEQGIDAWIETLDKLRVNTFPGPVLLAWDSLAASPPLAEWKAGSSEDALVAVQARVYSRMFRAIVGRLPRVRACALFVNQERAGIGMFSPNPRIKPVVNPGGSAAKYYCTMRMRNRVAMKFGSGDKSTGLLICSETKKSKLVPPFRRVEWVLDFKYGPSPALTTLQNLLTARKAKMAGGKYTFPWTAEKYDRDAFVEAYMLEPMFRKEAVTVSVQATLARQTNQPEKSSESEEAESAEE